MSARMLPRLCSWDGTRTGWTWLRDGLPKPRLLAMRERAVGSFTTCGGGREMTQRAESGAISAITKYRHT